MKEPKDEKALINAVQSAVADYCNEHDDQDFVIDLAIYAEQGWVKANKLLSKTVH